MISKQKSSTTHSFLAKENLNSRKSNDKPQKHTPQSLLSQQNAPKDPPAIGLARKNELIALNTQLVSLKPQASSSTGSHTDATLSTCSKHTEIKATYLLPGNDILKKDPQFMCVDCALSYTMKSPLLNIDQKLTRTEKTKKTALDSFLRRIDMFRGCLRNNLDTTQRKLQEAQSRLQTDLKKIQDFFTQLSTTFNELYSR